MGQEKFSLFLYGLQAGVLSLLLGASLVVSAQPGEGGGRFALSREGWCQGSFLGTTYSENLDGITLVPASIISLWSSDAPDTMVTDAVVDNFGRTFVTGSRRKGALWELWLGVLNPGGSVGWEVTGLEAPSREWSHGLALAQLPGGNLVVTGYAGDGLLLASFTPAGRRLWCTRLRETEALLGQDVMAWGENICVAAVSQAQAGTQGCVLCFNLKGTLLWKRVLPGSVEATRLARYGEQVLVLWRGKDGWSISGLSLGGEERWVAGCPEGFQAAALFVGDRGAYVIGHETSADGQLLGVVVLRIDSGSVNRVLHYPASDVRVRGAAFGLGGQLLAGGTKGNRGLILVWGPDWQPLQEETLNWGGETQVQEVTYGGNGGWVVTAIRTLPEGMSSRVSWWAPARGKRSGEYVSPTWHLDASAALETLTVRASLLREGEVRLILETSRDLFATVLGRWEWKISAEEERLALEGIPWAPSIRVRIKLSGTETGAPVVHQLEVVEGNREGKSAQPASLAPSVPASGGEVTAVAPLPSTVVPAAAPTSPSPTSKAIGGLTETVPRITTSSAVGLAGVTTLVFSLVNSDLIPGSWNWDFGDGATGVGNPIGHVYRTPGRYTVRAFSESQGLIAQLPVVVYRVQVSGLSILFHRSQSRLVPGDFDGDGWTDLAM